MEFSDSQRRRLEDYAALLLKWNKTHNLIGKSTEADIWNRHILDSAQLMSYLPEDAESLLDLGSGAGFPGVVLAVLGAGNVHLVESNLKKAAFLEEAARVTGAKVSVHACRVESLPPFPVSVVTARAFAPLDRLLEMAEPFLNERSELLLLKGNRFDEELRAAKKSWRFEESRFPSALKHGIRELDAGFVCRFRQIKKWG